ncbi:MAG: zinc-binding dehydrogenase [Verrucomicrobiales bacterium]|nr:zinc-binding dehydrogenase [Verrucomicrobiales bacterium]
MPKARAAVFYGPGRPLEVQSFRIPEPGPDELVVRISCATICGSDLHTVRGRRVERTPCILGHEAVGHVEAAGRDRGAYWVGRRISWTLTNSCGRCVPCLRWNLPQKCERVFKYGHAPLGDGSGFNGCYASHVVLRRGTTVVSLPDSVEDAVAAPANCALATMVGATESLRTPGDLVVIQGAGLLGIYGCALLRSFGWNRVLVVDRNPGRLRMVASFGGVPIAADAAGDLPAGSADVVVEACGDSSVIPAGVRLLRTGGSYHWVGMVHPESRLELTGEAVIRKCISLRGHHNYAPRHLAEGIRFLERTAGDLPWHQLVSPPMGLDAIDEALRVAGSGEWARVSIRPDSEM